MQRNGQKASSTTLTELAQTFDEITKKTEVTFKVDPKLKH